MTKNQTLLNYVDGLRRAAKICTDHRCKEHESANRRAVMDALEDIALMIYEEASRS